jgi:formiminotetrahydrofolate cyclodeaminase
MAVESAKLVINAPKANVKLNLKSIHDLSHLHCARAEIIVNESFDKCLVYDQLKEQFVKIGDF